MKQVDAYKSIVDEWDEIARDRYEDLINGNDESYNKLLKPSLLSTLKGDIVLTNVLDIGCGVGVFTEELGKLADKVTAIDISKKSIDIAKESSKNRDIDYKHVDFFAYSSTECFSAIVSNMTLMAIPDINGIFHKVYQLLKDNGYFIFTITHPSFWPIYWNYNNDGFDYKVETEIIREFKIKNKTYSKRTRHYHRPMEYYINRIISSGLKIHSFKELKFENEGLWYPRFLLLVCKK